MHHIAIGTKNLTAMTEFYKKIPSLQFLEYKTDDEGFIRSAWFQTQEGTILMLEVRQTSKAPEALVFRFSPKKPFMDFLSSVKEQNRTKYTIYFNDPDGNTLGYSSYPEEIFPLSSQ